MSNHVRQRDLKRGGSRHTKVSRYRKKRPKTFKTVESAKRWAEEQGIKSYTLVDLKENSEKSNKIKVVY